MRRIIGEFTLLSKCPSKRLPVKHMVISKEEMEAGTILIYLLMAVLWLIFMGVIGLILFR